MRVLIGTPCGGGQVTVQFLLSFVDTMNQCMLHKQEISRQVVAQIPDFDQKNPQHAQALAQTLNKHCYDIALYTLSGESLLARGRNHIAAAALEQGFDKVFFIDSDEGWTWEQFRMVVESPHPLTAGCVPLKTYTDYPNSFRTSLNYLPFMEDEIHFDRAIRDLAATKRLAAAHKSPLVKVAFTGTGYMCIDKDVLIRMAEVVPDYNYPNPYTGEVTTHWAFFDGGPMDGQYFSEDWKFCDNARKLGFDVVIHTDVLVTHTGPTTFRAG